MPKTLSLAALATALAITGPALAQVASPGAARQAVPQTSTSPSATSSASSEAAPPSTTPPTSSASGSGSGASAASPSGTNAAANVGANAMVNSGMSVKDNTGATIGQVSEVKNGVATIKMGADTFAVDTSKLAVQNGAATINASQSDIKKMLPKK